MDTQKIRQNMRQTLRYNPNDYLDCGEVNATKLAEDTCQAMDAYVGDDETIPEEFFEVASEVATDYENAQRGY